MKKIGMVVAIVLSCAVITCAADFQKEYKVKSGQKLEMDLQSGGRIFVTGWDQEKVSIEADIDGSERDVEINEGSSGISIIYEYEGRHGDGGHADFRVKVPKKFDLDLTTAGGSITLNGIDGKLQGKTMGGKLNFTGLGGTLDFTTMGGEISLTNPM
jgi:hypothetical protein